jgi:ABC-type multidrug transport system ATPase subunit
MNAGALIQCRSITKRFGRTNVLSDVDVSIGGGQVVGIVGENGSGKSTLLQILAGIMPPTNGSVEHHGSIGYCPQDALVFEALTVTENLRYFGAAVGVTGSLFEKRAESLLTTLGLSQYRSRLVGQLSGGSKQKLNLVVALLDDPAVLLLDEPCSGLDWEAYLSFWALADQARDAGKSVVIVSHLLHERGNFDAVLMLRNGAISR